jgi:hypothetical protein
MRVAAARNQRREGPWGGPPGNCVILISGHQTGDYSAKRPRLCAASAEKDIAVGFAWDPMPTGDAVALLECGKRNIQGD